MKQLVMSRSNKKQQSNRLIFEGNSQVVNLPKPDAKLKWATEYSFLSIFFQNDYSAAHVASGLGKITTSELSSKIKLFDCCPSIEENLF